MANSHLSVIVYILKVRVWNQNREITDTRERAKKDREGFNQNVAIGSKSHLIAITHHNLV